MDLEKLPFKLPMAARRWMFRRKLSALPRPTGTRTSGSDGTKGAWLILYDGQDPWQLDLAKLLAQYRRPDYFCQTLGLVRHAQADLNSFHTQELSNALLPPDRIVSLARSRSFDLCINLCPSYNPPLEYLVLVASSQLKIGVNRNQPCDHYNLELGLKLAPPKPSMQALLRHLTHLGLHTLQESKLQSMMPSPANLS